MRTIKTIQILMLIFLFAMGWCGYQFWSIYSFGEITPKTADVIIVLGAAVWENGPSPALRARIHHAQQLFHQGYADYFILSGGQGLFGPSEAQVMADLLKQYGIDESYLILEDQSTSTFENLRFSKEKMDEYGFQSAIIVTDTFHMKRALLIAKDVGISSYGSAAKESILNQNMSLKIYYTLREILAITAYHIFE